MFPPAMLDNLYVRGSLHNTDGGFQLKFRNTIDYGTLVGMGFLVVDGVSYAPSSITVKVGAREITGDQITYRSMVSVPVGAEVVLVVAGQLLAPGPHSFTCSLNEWQIGRIQFDVTDDLT
jgi:hypothetical protein